jgi:multidrug efflux pump subunit AcrB
MTCNQGKAAAMGFMLIGGAAAAVFFLKDRQPRGTSPQVENPTPPQPMPVRQSFPTIHVTVPCPGFAPEEVERLVTVRLERWLGVLDGIKELRSRSLEGMCQLTISFDKHDQDSNLATQVQVQLLSAQPTLPPGVGPATIERTGPDEMPAFWLTVESKRHSLLETTQLFEAVLQPRLRALPGVARLREYGGSKHAAQVRIDLAKLQARGLTVAQIAAALEMDGAKKPDKPIAPAELGDTVISAQGGTPIFLRDVAAVVDAGEPIGYAWRDRRRLLAVGVYLREGAMAKQVFDSFYGTLADARKEFPENMTVELLPKLMVGNDTRPPNLLVEVRLLNMEGSHERLEESVRELQNRIETEANREGQQFVAWTLAFSDRDGSGSARIVLEISAAAPSGIDETIRRLAEGMPGLRVRVIDLRGQPLPLQATYPVRITLVANELVMLRNWADETIRRARQAQAELRDVDAPAMSLTRRTDVVPDRATAAALAMTAREIVESFEFAMHGKAGNGYRLVAGAVNDPTELGELPILTGNGKHVPLRNVATIKTFESVTAIDRINGRRCVEISANAGPHIAIEQAQAKLRLLAEEAHQKMKLPANCKVMAD